MLLCKKSKEFLKTHGINESNENDVDIPENKKNK